MDNPSKDDIYKGHLISKKFQYENMDIKWLTYTHHWYEGSSPFLIFESDDILYYGVGDYQFKAFETYTDWDAKALPNHFFDYWQLTRCEDWEYLLTKTDFTYYEFDYIETMKSDLDEFCQFELDIIEDWHKRHKRNTRLDILTKKDS